MEPSLLINVNGALIPAPSPQVSALDRGFTLGDGVFETMRLLGGRVFRLEDHLARLRRSAAVLALPVPLSDASLGQAIAMTAEANGLREAVVRLTLTRGVPDQRGLLPPAAPAPTVVVHAMTFGTHPAERYERGLAGCLSRIRRNETSPASAIKSCSYVDNVLARLEAAAAGADEAIMLNTIGHLAGGASSNVYVVSRGVVATPPPGSGALMGITRGVVRGLVPTLGLTWRERALSPAELAHAEEAFLTNAVMGVMPLTSLDGRPIGSGRPGPATLAVMAAYRRLLESFGET